MAPKRWETVQKIFLKALDLSEDQRESYLSETCREDRSLRREVEGLLEADANVESHFVVPGSTPFSKAGTLGELTSEQTSAGPLSEEVGPYKILRVLGEGGMGVVYLAEQQEPVRRRVALKVIKPGMDTKEVVARFELERQALALLNHPNIAKVYYAGATDDGRPYFVMEPVEGVPITEYCDRHIRNLRERLDLFVQVCRGIQHAHHNGIIHRDIKPSNVLVTVPDEEPVAKIIDFGVARATNQRLTEKTLYTEVGRAVGTPAYMSPEQAELTPELVDHRTDIYSLGVLLYELLVGQLPLDQEVLGKAAFHEILRRIREEEPATPSVRWTRLNLEQTARVAHKRRTSPGVMRQELRGDLDWITMKALEKDRSRRYSTAMELATDIGRHLCHEPVFAGPPSIAYLARKYVRRNRVPVAAVTVVVAVLCVSLVAISWFASVSQERLTEIVRLADIKELQNFEQTAGELWPALPAKISAMEDWLRSVEPLAGRLDLHRSALLAVQRRGIDSAEAQWEHDTLTDIVLRLERFTDQDPKIGTLASVHQRLKFARTVQERSLLDHTENWERAAASITNSEQSPLYGGFRLSPQLGLVPLGQDRSSGLWEFAHLQSGKVATRGPDGNLQMTEETGLVLVLIPGGDFWMGATGLEVTGTQENNSFFVNDVKEKSVAERLGIKSGDRILVVNGQSLSKKISFRVAQRQLIQDEPFSLRLLREGSEKTLTATTDFSFDPYAEPDESPVHRVEIKPFFLSKYEMTQGQWLRSTGKNPSYYPAGKTVGGQQFSLLHPVEYVSWERCRDILRWNDLDLPSEAQWEYAARAGTKTVWSTGNDLRTLQDHANIADYFLAQKFPSMSSQCESTINDGYAGHAPIASYKANHFGLHDMEGNVSEWCDDSYFEGGYRRSPKPASERKVGRGGRWSHNARYSRSADRGAFVASTRRQDLGMRPMRRVRP